MKSRIGSSFIWAVLILILGMWAIYTVRIYTRDQNKIYAASERATCQIELMKANQNDFSICTEIFTSTPRENSIF